MAQDGWPALFATAFRESKNAMALVDEQRRHIEVNPAYLRLLGYSRDGVLGRPVYQFVVNGPLLSPARWSAALASGRFHGEAELIRADGTHVGVQWAGNTEFVTGRRLVLFVALGTSRWGRASAAHPRPIPSRGAVRARARDRAADRARGVRARDRRGAPHRPRHGPHARAQRDDEGRRALARAPRREGAGRGPRPRLKIPHLRYRLRGLEPDHGQAGWGKGSGQGVGVRPDRACASGCS